MNPHNYGYMRGFYYKIEISDKEKDEIRSVQILNPKAKNSAQWKKEQKSFKKRK